MARYPLVTHTLICNRYGDASGTLRRIEFNVVATKMSAYVVYIDESGDEGFQFLDNERGSSRWLILSAVVFRKDNDVAAVQLLRKAREVIGKQPKKALHFRELKHEHRIPYARAIGEEKLLTVSVAIHKPDLRNREHY